MKTGDRRAARASAPASIGNVGVGFDVLGLAFDVARDVVSVEVDARPGVRLGRVTGTTGPLPAAVMENTALRAADAVLQAKRSLFGLQVHIDKAIPTSAGMGGSAASAAAAALATLALFDDAPTADAVLPFAMEGERASSDPPPWDNVAASLYGGLVLVAGLEPPMVRRLPAPRGLAVMVFHPDAKIDTAAARAALAPQTPLALAVDHARHLAAFVAGCAGDDRALIARGLHDVLIEPQRLTLFPTLKPVQAAALAAGALGCSFSGAGPSVFALADEERAAAVEAAMAAAFDAEGVGARAYRAAMDGAGARVEPVLAAASA